MTVGLTFFTEQQIKVFLEQIVSVYQEAFRAFPYGRQEEEVLEAVTR